MFQTNGTSKFWFLRKKMKKNKAKLINRKLQDRQVATDEDKRWITKVKLENYSQFFQVTAICDLTDDIKLQFS